MNIDTPNGPWAGTAPAAGSASPPPAGEADQAGAGEAGANEDGKPFRFFGGDGISFADLIDIVNPLQHVPVIGYLYRGVTGDGIDPGARLLGGTLFFGPLGTVGAGVNVLLQHETGKDLGGHVASLFTDGEAAVEVAAGAATPSAAPLAAAGTDGGGANGEGVDEDPISAWARGERAWAEAQAASRAPTSREPGLPAPPGRAPSPLPDAERWLRDAPTATPTAAGSAPPAPGSWFSETVLSSAADKYRAAQRLTAGAA